MPYIKQDDRQRLEYENLRWANPESTGELNYLITKLCINYYNACGPNYDGINAVMGVLECVKQEFYRRVAVPYEEEKIRENGDVY